MSRTKARYVLGTGLSHDGSACLLKDGEICVAIEKERITRRKHDGMHDMAAIQYCLEAEGIALDDLELIVQNANFGMFRYGNGWFRGPRPLPPSVPVVTMSHHLAHAYSALCASPFDDAAVLVIDGCGNSYDECQDLQATVPERPAPGIAHLYFEKDSFYGARDRALVPLYKDFSPWGVSLREYPMHPDSTQHSIGGVYSAASYYAFNGLDDAGKLMGLAPYGRAGTYDAPIFDLVDGRVFVRYDWMHRFDRPARGREALRQDFQYYADIAYWVQREVERAILYVIASRRDLHPSENLCYAGGVALNAVANRRILQEAGYRRVFIQPAAGDNGLAIGCAYYGWLEVLKEERRRHSGSTCFGRVYGAETCAAALREQESAGRVEVQARENVIEETARLLADGQVIGWFQGGSEFGPRALGNRSILADPRRASVRDFINRDIKCREDFRPFAPSVLLEETQTYFDCEYDSPYMLLVAPVREAWRSRIPSVVHQDGSARIQTVSEESNPLYYALLRAFLRLTGVGVLLNTSLNRRGMPIVETPAEAIDFFLTSGLHALVLGDTLLVRRTVHAEAAETDGIGTLRDLFEHEVPARLQRVNGAVPLTGIVQVNVSRRVSWVLDLSARDVRPVAGGSVPIVHAAVDVEEQDWLALFSSRQASLGRLLDRGRLKISGDAGVALSAAKALGFME